MATYHCQIKTGNKGSGACASAKADYVTREGKYADKPDLEGKPWHGNMPTFAQANPGEFWQAADTNERANGRVYTEIEIALPRDYSAAERRKMVEGFIAEQLPNNPYTVAIHCPKAAIEGGDQPHAHIVFSERIMDGIERDKEQFFKRAAAPYRDRVTKEMKEGDPMKGGAKKDLSWHSRDKIIEVRETWERHHNKAVYDVDQVSCKSLRDQGIDRESERHLGYTLARTAAADHVKDIRIDRQRSAELGREIVRAAKAEASRKEQERERQEEQKPAPIIVDQVQPIIEPEPLPIVLEVSPEVKIKLPAAIPQDIVIQSPPPKIDISPTAETKTERIQEVIQTPDTTRRGDPDQLQAISRDTISSTPVQKNKSVNPSVEPVVPEPAQSEALPIIKETNLPIQQPAFDFPALAGAELAAFAAFVQRMKNIAIENLVKLCQIASDMSKFTVQNDKGILSAEKYNDLTDHQEKQVMLIVAKAEFTYTPGQPAILIDGHPVPEIAKSQFVKPQAPAPTQGITRTGGRK
jgi:hypothetical protein